MFIELVKQIWPEWEIVRLIGEGSHGAVYEALRHDVAGDHRAAIKHISLKNGETSLGGG